MACGYCGVQQTVQREGGGVWLSLEKALAEVKATADRTNSELPLRRLTEERDATKSRLYKLRVRAANASKQSAMANFQIPIFVIVFGGLIMLSNFWSTGSVGSGGLFAGMPVFIVIIMISIAVAFGVNLSRNRTIKSDAEAQEIALEAQISELDQQIEETRRRVSL